MPTTTIEKQNKDLARPLNVLVPLIKQDIDKAHDAEKTAGMPYYIAAGEKLLEAKIQMNAIGWGAWLMKNFHVSQSQATLYMRLASDKAPEKFESLGHFRRTRNANFTSKVRWQQPVQEVLNHVKVERLNMEKHELSVAKEEKLERDLAMQLIDIGYKVLAVKLHPDKGGSAEAMQRLNNVRARLKEAA